MCTKLNIQQNIFTQASKIQANKMFKKYVNIIRQTRWCNYKGSRTLKLLKPKIGGNKVWFEGNRYETTILSQLISQHNFLNITISMYNKQVTPFCVKCKNLEDAKHFSLKCSRFTDHRKLLFDSTKSDNIEIIQINHLLLLGDTSYSTTYNQIIQRHTLTYIKNMGRVEEFLKWNITRNLRSKNVNT